MAPGVRDELAQEQHRSEASALAIIVAHLERLEPLPTKIDELSASLRAAQEARQQVEAGLHERIDAVDRDVRDLANRQSRIERHLGLPDPELGPEQERRPRERSGPARAVQGLTLTWPRVIAFAAVVFLAGAVVGEVSAAVELLARLAAWI